MTNTITINESWLETYYEFVDHISVDLYKPNTPYKLVLLFNKEGRTAMYDLAKKLTVEYEKKYADYEYDGDFYDLIDIFYDEYLKR